MGSTDSLPTVELIQAFVWTCDDCGRDNFERAVTFSPEGINMEDLPPMPGMSTEDIEAWIEAGGDGMFLTSPTVVTCPHCRAKFGTQVM